MRIDVGRIIDQLDETNRFWLDITTLTNYSYFNRNSHITIVILTEIVIKLS